MFALLAAMAFLTTALVVAAPNPNPPPGAAGPTAAAQQEPAVDTIHVTDDGKGVGASKEAKLNFHLDKDKNFARYGFKWTVTRANEAAMKKSTVKQEVFAMTEWTKLVNGKKEHEYHLTDKNHPERGGATGPTGWANAKKAWDNDGGIDRMTLDVRGTVKIDGTPEAVMEVYDQSALDGKRFSASDFPGVQRLDEAGLIEVARYLGFRLSSEHDR